MSLKFDVVTEVTAPLREADYAVYVVEVNGKE